MRRNFEGLVRCSGLFQLPNFTSSHMMKLSNSTHVLVSLNKHSKASHVATVINNHNGLQHGLGICQTVSKKDFASDKHPLCLANFGQRTIWGAAVASFKGTNGIVLCDKDQLVTQASP